MYQNSEIQSLITSVGLGARGEELSAASLRYERLVIMTDADVDGAHIRTLLLTFFYRYAPALIAEGHVFVACPPLYKVTVGQRKNYCATDAEMEHLLSQHPRATVQRFKGLGAPAGPPRWSRPRHPSPMTGPPWRRPSLARRGDDARRAVENHHGPRAKGAQEGGRGGRRAGGCRLHHPHGRQCGVEESLHREPRPGHRRGRHRRVTSSWSSRGRVATATWSVPTVQGLAVWPPLNLAPEGAGRVGEARLLCAHGRPPGSVVGPVPAGLPTGFHQRRDDQFHRGPDPTTPWSAGGSVCTTRAPGNALHLPPLDTLVGRRWASNPPAAPVADSGARTTPALGGHRIAERTAAALPRAPVCTAATSAETNKKKRESVNWMPSWDGGR